MSCGKTAVIPAPGGNPPPKNLKKQNNTNTMETQNKIQYEAPEIKVVELRTDTCILQNSIPDYPYYEVF